MISKKEYANRRKKLLEQMQPNSLMILFSADLHRHNHDAELEFRQQSDFRYFTGLLESDAVAIFAPGREEGEFILFNQPFDPLHEIWHGKLAGQEGAVTEYGADQSFAISDLKEKLPEIFAGRKIIYHALVRDQQHTSVIVNAIEALQRKVRFGAIAPTTFINSNTLTHEMRLIKSDEEIEAMRYVAKMSAEAHVIAMQNCKPGKFEYQLQADIEHHTKQHGCMFMAYTPIVGGGRNACVLHYIENNCKLNDGELLLIDAGAEYEGYAADITRTFPTNGKFTPEQKAIYDLVLKAQQACLDIVKPGIEFFEMQKIIIKTITTGLVELGLLQGDVEQLIKEEKYKQFYMHLNGHWLGLDTHDVGTYKPNNQWRKLAPGHVITIEPGIYITAADNVDKKWHNIGVRIEDDVLITEQGHEILSVGLPRTTEEVEAIMAK